MPICKREGFDIASFKKDETFQDNDKVFFCEVTKQIFREYEDYFRHVMVINSTVWQCEATGRANLTFAEALKSERRARKKMELFKDSLRPPVIMVIEHAKQSAMNTLHKLIIKFIRRRYFIDEEVSAYQGNGKYQTYKVLEIIPNPKTPPVNDVYENTENLKYKLISISEPHNEIIVPYENIRRNRMEFTSDNLHMFLKENVTRVDGILHPKPESYKKYITDRNITFSKIFIGKMQHFTPAKIKRPAANGENKKQSTINNYLVKNETDVARGEMIKNNKNNNAADMLKRKKEAEEKAKSLKEQMERIRLEKQARIAALEREKIEKRAKLMKRIETECTLMLTKTDDLERRDQRMLPKYKPIQTLIPIKLFGDAIIISEFMYSFANTLSGLQVFRNNLQFNELTRALTTREVAGPLADIFLILLGTIFDLQKEEEDEMPVEYLKLRPELKKREPWITMGQASMTHFYSKRHFAFKINDLPIDPLSLSEVLRLHLLSSGAVVTERAEKWRITYRNGYCSSEDPGLALRMQYPHILRALKMYTIFQLPFLDIMRVLRCLTDQILTYSTIVAVVENRMELMAKSRMEIRLLAQQERTRLASVQVQKRTLTNEFAQQCMSEEVGNDAEKKQILGSKLNVKIDEMMSRSDKERKKYEQKVEKLHASLINFVVFLGMDRAYRKYYIMNSLPGIFIEHSTDCYDTCLNDPPLNALPDSMCLKSNLPKQRNNLRSYLLKAYTDEEKKKSEQNSVNEKNKISTVESATTNQANKENHLVNGLNGHYDSKIEVNGHAENVENIENDETTTTQPSSTSPPTPPTQYQLYMCTGDPRNCIVHNDRNPDRQRWSYIYEKEEVEALIDALNPMGERESQLRDQLNSLRSLILKHVQKCPYDMLNIDSKEMSKFKSSMLSDTNRKYNKSNFGYNNINDLNDVMQLTLMERILQFERDIYTGNLGVLKVKDMPKWRLDLANGTYDPQSKLQWGTSSIRKMNNGKGTAATIGDEEDESVDEEDSGKFTNKPYQDPGFGLGDSLEIDSEDSDDDCPLHESPTLQTSVKNLASALLQVEQAIERRFIKEPFGAPVKELKNKELLEAKIKTGTNNLKQWEVSLMESTSYSQIFLHLNTLHDSILWARSINKSYCQVCRRGSDPDKMLLCDECNGGTHMFCLKPKLNKVPEGNWYCFKCVQRLGLKNENRKSERKKFIVTEEQEEEEEEEENENEDIASVSSAASGGDSTSSRTKIQERHRASRSSKRLRSNEIMDILENDDDEDEAEAEDEIVDENEDQDTNGDLDESADEEEEEEENDNDEEDDDDNDDNDGEDDNSETEEAQNHVDEEKSDINETENEDENVCVVCSYDGGDLLCVRCKDVFHMECINIKRPPRYIFVCPKCKTTEEKTKRKAKQNDSSDEGDSDSTEPPLKRTRTSRTRHSNNQLNNSSNDRANNNINNNNNRRSNRRTGDNLPLNSSALYELLDDIMKHENAWPFLRPVLQSEVPDYYKIIKYPMDLAKVKSKLNMGKYQLNEEVMKDIQLIFNNCDTYNVEGNEIYQAGSTLEKFVIQRCKELRLPFHSSDMNA